ncbi:MAG: hypothetical protein OHK0013_03070 [Sandaracinaceae bacterium]
MTTTVFRGATAAIWRALCVVGLAAMAGCGGVGFHMRAATTPASFGTPPEGRAQVVFVMHGRSRDVVGIVDQRGTYYGQLRGETVLVRDVAPGRYRFYAIRSTNGYVVDVPHVEAGQTVYLGGVDPVFTSFVWRSFSGCDAEAVAARGALSRLARVEPDPSVPIVTVLAQLGDIPRRVAEADRDFDAMRPEQRALRTVDAEALARGGRCDGTQVEPAPDAPTADAPTAMRTPPSERTGGRS